MSYLKSLQNLRRQIETDTVAPVQVEQAPRPIGIASRPNRQEIPTPQYEPLTFAKNAIKGVREAKQAFANNLKNLNQDYVDSLQRSPLVFSDETTSQPTDLPPVEEAVRPAEGQTRPRSRPNAGELHTDLSQFEAPEQELRALAQAIKDIESSGGDYSVRGRVIERGRYRGERAMGAYQVMPGNLPEWSRLALGRVVTEEEFMENPEIQDTIFFDQMMRNYRRHGSWEDAASVWFTGRPAREGARASDGGLTGSQYVNRFTNRFNLYLGNS